MSIVNRVAESGLIQFDPATLVKDAKVTVVSLSSFLNEDKILREKPFRQAIAAHDAVLKKNREAHQNFADAFSEMMREDLGPKRSSTWVK